MLTRPIRKIGLISCFNKPYPGKQGGIVAIIVAIALPILIGFAGLALDLGKLFVTKTELQNAADACALSAANELTGVTTQFASAETAGIATGQANKVFFQTAAVSLPANSAVSFSQTLNGAYSTQNSLTGLTTAQAALYKYVKCTATKSNIANWLIQVLNLMPGITVANQQAVAASAVATLAPSQNSCSLLPIGVCSTAVNATTPIGTWVAGIIAPGTATLSGSFRWVDLNGSSGSASAIAAILSGNVCLAPPSPGATLTASGFKASNRDDYNTRFGLKHGSADGVPDYTGYSYYPVASSWPSGNNAYSDFVSERTSNTAYQGDAKSGIKLTGGTGSTTIPITKGSSRRLMVAPVVDCSTMKLSASSPTFACLLLLHPMQTQGASNFTMYLEYLGDANKESPCNQTGLAGSSTSTGPVVSALVQ
ncbi:MAG: pilus assembly protein TadG-related protein [Pseudomonadota bacterium]